MRRVEGLAGGARVEVGILLIVIAAIMAPHFHVEMDQRGRIFVLWRPYAAALVGVEV